MQQRDALVDTFLVVSCCAAASSLCTYTVLYIAVYFGMSWAFFVNTASFFRDKGSTVVQGSNILQVVWDK
jgi:hypothetical protein